MSSLNHFYLVERLFLPTLNHFFSSDLKWTFSNQRGRRGGKGGLKFISGLGIKTAKGHCGGHLGQRADRESKEEGTEE